LVIVSWLLIIVRGFLTIFIFVCPICKGSQLFSFPSYPAILEQKVLPKVFMKAFEFRFGPNGKAVWTIGIGREVFKFRDKTCHGLSLGQEGCRHLGRNGNEKILFDRSQPPIVDASCARVLECSITAVSTRKKDRRPAYRSHHFILSAPRDNDSRILVRVVSRSLLNRYRSSADGKVSFLKDPTRQPIALGFGHNVFNDLNSGVWTDELLIMNLGDAVNVHPAGIQTVFFDQVLYYDDPASLPMCVAGYGYKRDRHLD